jgi:hypothetical protein
MKTSNILLLSLFGLILLSITTILVAFGSDMNTGMAADNETMTGKAEQVRNLAHFNKVEIGSRFNVQYTQDTFQRIVIKGDSSLMGLVLTEVTDGKLFIHSKRRLRNRQHIDIIMTTDSINEVKANAGSTFKTMRKMKAHQFDGTGNAGSVFQIDGDFTNLNVDFNAGCVGDFSGQCKNLGIRSNAGSVLNAGNLVADKGNVSSSSGSVITINVTGELSVDASSGSVIKCQGNPQLKGFNISSGAQFIK